MDVLAATNAYLSTIPPAQAAKAVAYTHGGHWILLGNKVVAIVAAALIARTGMFRRTTDRDPASGRSAGTIFRAGATFLLAFSVLSLPWAAYSSWYRERSYGFSKQAFPGWLGEYVIQSIITDLIGAVLLLLFYSAMRRAGRRWWLWASAIAGVGLSLALIVQPVLISPLLNKYAPAPNGPAREGIKPLLESSGFSGDQVFVYDGSRQSSRYTASVTGFGRTAKVALSDAMFAKGADPEQVRAVVAHEIGHQRHLHLVILAVFLTLLVAAGLLIADRAFDFTTRCMGSSATIGQVKGLPSLFVIFACYTLLTTPLVNTAQRMIETDADRYGLALANEPDGMARALIASADYRAGTPSPLEEALFYDHPSTFSRIQLAMRWKAAHAPGKAAPRDGVDPVPPPVEATTQHNAASPPS